MYVWSRSYLKATEDGIGTTTAKSVLKGEEGIKVYSGRSSLIGHSVLEVTTKTKRKMRKALSLLKDYGYISSIKEEMEDCVAEWPS